MANLIRSAKSGSEWTLNDLESYNIQLQQQDALTFFGVQQLPEPSVDPELLSNVSADAMQQDHHAELINLLDLAMVPSYGESAVNDFTVELFRILGYVRRDRVARTRKDLHLLICGEYRHAKTDVCLIDHSQNDIILLVQEDKRIEDREPTDAQAQLVAEAIAAFAENNGNRRSAELDPLSQKVSIRLRDLFNLYERPHSLGYGWNRYVWHITHILQNSRHRNSVDPYQTWHISSRHHMRDILSAACSASRSPAQRGDETPGQ